MNFLVVFGVAAFLCFLIGYATHWILGVIIFFKAFPDLFKWAAGLTIFNSIFNEHHRRNDERARKQLESELYIREQEAMMAASSYDESEKKIMREILKNTLK